MDQINQIKYDLNDGWQTATWLQLAKRVVK